MDQSCHIPVMLEEICAALSFQEESKGQLVLDCTLGGGGHSHAILKQNPDCYLVGMDRDSSAILRAKSKLIPFRERIELVCCNFSEIEFCTKNLSGDIEKLFEQNGQTFQRILIDLGISSDQLDNPERGFSFSRKCRLDMRMDQSQDLTAEKIVNEYSLWELKRVFDRGGVGKFSLPLAREIIKHRPISDSQQLASICLDVTRRMQREKRKEQHPATVPFQALRIEVNGEFDSIDAFFKVALKFLSKNGKIAVISFHSLEDKIVTQYMRKWTQVSAIESRIPVIGSPKGVGRLLTKSAMTPGEEEIKINPRSRSARLRIFEKY
jgi:16S rRNA (cytosine1402-N4)-methyltransferase